METVKALLTGYEIQKIRQAAKDKGQKAENALRAGLITLEEYHSLTATILDNVRKDIKNLYQ